MSTGIDSNAAPPVDIVGYSQAEVASAIAEARAIGLRVNTVDEAFEIGYAYGRRDGRVVFAEIAHAWRERLQDVGLSQDATDLLCRIEGALHLAQPTVDDDAPADLTRNRSFYV